MKVSVHGLRSKYAHYDAFEDHIWLIRRGEIDHTIIHRKIKPIIFRTMLADSLISLELMLKRARVLFDL
jgi:hypothetical protein